jgi:hypothetical protein
VAAAGNAPPSRQFKEVYATLSAAADVQLDKLNAIIRTELPALNTLIYAQKVPVISVKEKVTHQ